VKPQLRAALLILLTSFLTCTGLRAADLAPYDINVLVSLTGPATFAGQRASEALHALEKVVNQQGGINGRPVRFVYHDDQSSPQVAVQLARQIIAQDVPVLLGPAFSPACRAVIPLVVNGPVEYCFSAGVIPAKGSYAFSTGTSTEAALLRNFEFLRKRGWTRVAILTTTDTTGQDADDNIGTALARPENSSIKVVDHEHFNSTDISIAAQISRIRAAAPQVLFGWTTGPPVGTIFQELKTAGYDIPVVTSAGNVSYPLVKQYAAFLPKELYFGASIYATGSINRRNAAPLRAFYDAYAAMGIKPDMLAGIAWDPALILIDALRHAGPAPTAAKVHDYVENLHGFPGIVGVYDFRDGSNRGIGLGDVYETTWDPNQYSFVVVK
jgi:branched-chain amino acid transport system substrate-binding protein